MSSIPMAIDNLAAEILNERHDAFERMLASRAGQDVAKLNAAYKALTGRTPPPLSVGMDDEDSQDEAPVRRGPRKGSVRYEVKQILENEPMIWTYEILADALGIAGFDVRDDDGKVVSSVRGAAWTLVNDDDARRGPGGTIYATVHEDELVRMGMLPQQTAFSQPSPDEEEVA